ncbi:MAG: pilus assembly protein PilM [Ignavibacteriales bacterium]|nr:MAG: pilus assembly protein PilM [Ignavibacteriales bacterium]
MNGFENRIGISVSSVRLQLVELSFSDNRYYVSNFDEAYYSEPLNFSKEKTTKLSALLQGAFNEILIRKPLKSKTVSFSLPLDLFYLLQVPVDNSLLHSELSDDLKWQLSVAYPFLNIDELSVNFIEIPSNTFCDLNTALVAAIDRKYIGIINSFCSLNKLNLKYVDNIHFASERTLSSITKDENNELVLSIYISNSNLSMLFTHKGNIIAFRYLPFESISDAARLINEEISNNNLLRLKPSDISSVYIFGDDITDGFVNSLSESTKLILNKINPFTNFHIENNSPGLIYQRERYNSFASAAGIAYRTA